MFEGYSPETVDFLWGLRMNNNREWFQAHKHEYVRWLYEPTKALGAELFAPFLDRPGDILKVSRIYRDARLHHPLPYKESLWICIRRDVQWWAENPCLFFQIDPDGVDYGFSLWHPRPTMMKQLRSHIAAEPAQFIAMIDSVEQAVGRTVTAAHYIHPAACPQPSLERFYLWKDRIECIAHEDFSPAVFDPSLAQRVREDLTRLLPLYDYFNRFSV